MIHRYIIEATDEVKGFEKAIEKLDREWGIEELEPCEDAISRLEVRDLLATWLTDNLTEETWEALETIDGKVEDMQSVIPKTKPCEDAISRQAVEKITWEEPSYTDALNVLTEVREKIRQLPPVTSWSDWIPATQLPEPNTAVLLYVRYKSSSQRTYQLGMWNDNKQAWEDWRTPYQLEEEFEVIKWMELPEGYEEGNHE